MKWAWLRWLLLLAALVLTGCVIEWWPHIRNETFVLFGNRNEPGGYYGWWSGFGGALQVFTLAFGAAMVYYHHTCHARPLCLRWGKYEAAGGMFKLCAGHHPDIEAKRPRPEMIHRLHREHQERIAGKTP